MEWDYALPQVLWDASSFYLIHIALSKIMFVVATLNLAHVHVLSIFLLKIRIYVGQAP